MRYRGFISYSQRDTRQAQRLHRALERYRVPSGVKADGVDKKTRRLGRFFRDTEEMAAAADIGGKVRKALDESENLVVLCSPRSAQSYWVQSEIEYFRNLGRPDRVFAVIMDGQPNSHDARTECFPRLLQSAQEESTPGTMPVEPVGIDMRKDKLSRVCARIAAGVLGVEFDDLWQRDRRETRRRARQRFAIEGGAFAIVAALGGVLYFTNSNLIGNQISVYASLADRLSGSLISARPTALALSVEQLGILSRARDAARQKSLAELQRDLAERNEQAGWSVAQAVLGLNLDDGSFRKDAIALIQQTRLHGEPCWPEYVSDGACHVIATSWVTYVLSRVSDYPTARAAAATLLDLQSSDGWWPAYFDLHGDDAFAATYPTAWAVLALSSQISTADDRTRARIQSALQRAVRWLLSTESATRHRWKDYPNSSRGAFLDGVSALAVIAINVAGNRTEVAKLNRDWLLNLPMFPEKIDFLERSQVDLGRSWRWDRTSYVVTPWVAVSAATAAPDGNDLGLAKAGVYLDEFLNHSASFTRADVPSFFSEEFLHCLDEIRRLVALSS